MRMEPKVNGWFFLVDGLLGWEIMIKITDYDADGMEKRRRVRTSKS